MAPFQSRRRTPRVLFLPAVRRRKQPLHGASQRRHVHAMRVSERHCKCYYQTSWVNHEKDGGHVSLIHVRLGYGTSDSFSFVPSIADRAGGNGIRGDVVPVRANSSG